MIGDKQTIRAQWSNLEMDILGYHHAEATIAGIIEMRIMEMMINGPYSAHLNDIHIGMFDDANAAKLAAETQAIHQCYRVIHSLEDLSERQ